MKGRITCIVSLAAICGLFAMTPNITQAQTGVIPAGGPITVFGTPLSGSGTQGICPGSYTGYAYFYNTNSPTWGFSPTPGATVLTATDTNRTDTKIQYIGWLGDTGCNQTSVTIPSPAYSTNYFFIIYFKNNVPTNVYPLQLTGFNP